MPKPKKAPDNILWAGTEASHADWLLEEQWIATATAEDLAALGPEVYVDAEEDEFGASGYMVSRHEDTAIIEIHGKLVAGSAWYNQFLGRTGYGEIMEAFSRIAEVSGINQVLMNISSGGGSTDGVDETSKYITAFDKNVLPVYAHTSSNMLSAAMWIGSSARKRWATDMASVGSIGVIAVHKEYTEMFKKEGIKVTVFREGENKALVSPYEKLTEKAIDYIKTQMERINTFFVEALASNLSLTEAYIRNKIADGSEFFGAEAKSLGLIDKVGTLDSMLKGLVNKHQASSTNALGIGADTMSLKKGNTTENETTLSAEAQAAASAGAPLDVAVIEHPVLLDEITVEVETAETEAQAAAEETAALEAEAKPGEGMSFLIEKMAGVQREAAELRVKTEQLEAELAEAQAGATALHALCTEWCQRMQIPLGVPTLDSEGMSPGVLAKEVSRVKGIFDAKYLPGQKVEASSEGEDNSNEGVITSITQARRSAATFSK